MVWHAWDNIFNNLYLFKKYSSLLFFFMYIFKIFGFFDSIQFDARKHKHKKPVVILIKF